MWFFSKKSARVEKRKNFARARDGITTIEFAIIVPTLLMLVMGIVEFSMIMFVNIAMESATTSTARLGATGYTAPGSTQTQQIVQNVMNETAGLLNPNLITITAYAYNDLNQIPATPPTIPVTNPPTPPPQNFGGASQIVVYTVSYPWPITTPFFQLIFGSTYTITTRTVVQNEPYGT